MGKKPEQAAPNTRDLKVMPSIILEDGEPVVMISIDENQVLLGVQDALNFAAQVNRYAMIAERDAALWWHLKQTDQETADATRIGQEAASYEFHRSAHTTAATEKLEFKAPAVVEVKTKQ